MFKIVKNVSDLTHLLPLLEASNFTYIREKLLNIKALEESKVAIFLYSTTLCFSWKKNLFLKRPVVSFCF